MRRAPLLLLGGRQAPPPELDTVGKVVRFVSLIPYVSDAAVYEGRLHVWNTSDAFFATLWGDEEEHAVQLCNFLLAMGRDCFVVVGNGIPEGATAYVLMVESGAGDALDTNYLINPVTGRIFDARDVHCPLKAW